MVRLAKGPLSVLGTERSATQVLRRCREQGVWERCEDMGRMMWVLFWLAIAVEVAVLVRLGRSLLKDSRLAAELELVCDSPPSLDALSFEGGRSACSEDCSFGGVFMLAGVLGKDDPGVFWKPGER